MNARIIIFFGVLALLVGYPLYIYIDSELHSGIKDIGGGYKEVDLKAMSLFNFDQVSGTLDDVPIKWRQLDGQKIVTYGEMWDPQSASRYVDSFDLVYSIAKCCFSGPPQVQHFVRARPVQGTNLEYFNGLVKVKGTLHVDVVRDAEKVRGVYRLDVESIEQDAINVPWLLLGGIGAGAIIVATLVRRSRLSAAARQRQSRAVPQSASAPSGLSNAPSPH